MWQTFRYLPDVKSVLLRSSQKYSDKGEPEMVTEMDEGEWRVNILLRLLEKSCIRTIGKKKGKKKRRAQALRSWIRCLKAASERTVVLLQ